MQGYVPRKHETALVKGWSNVVEDEPTVKQSWTDVSCLQGCMDILVIIHKQTQALFSKNNKNNVDLRIEPMRRRAC